MKVYQWVVCFQNAWKGLHMLIRKLQPLNIEWKLLKLFNLKFTGNKFIAACIKLFSELMFWSFPSSVSSRILLNLYQFCEVFNFLHLLFMQRHLPVLLCLLLGMATCFYILLVEVFLLVELDSVCCVHSLDVLKSSGMYI